MSDNRQVMETRGRLRSTRGWQGVLAAGLAVLTAASITAVVGVSDPASADTFVTSVTDSVVALPNGSEREARIGDRLPSGARLRSGAAGGARLTTAGRDVYVGALSTILIRDGVRESLERGQVMVDTRSGPELALGTEGGTVDLAEGTLARVERGIVLRVGVFDGSAAVGVTGRQATTTVPALYQVSTQYGVLPGRPTALALTNDAWEQRLAANLTGADEQLTRLQSGLEGSEGSLVLVAAPAALRLACTGTDRGEQALSVALAMVAKAGSSPQDRATTVCSSRREGGSWGVVAAIVRASADDVSGRLQQDLPTDPAILAEGPTTPFLPGITPTSPTTAGPGDSTTGPTGSPSPRPTTTTGPRPPPPPPPPSTVEQVVTIVRDLLPTPVPSTTPAPSTAPLPAPSPLVTVPLGPITVGVG